MTGRRAALTVVVLIAGCASTPAVRDGAEFPVSQLRWNFERDALPPKRQAESLLGGSLGLFGRRTLDAIGGEGASRELGSLQEGIPMSLPDLSRTIARALGQEPDKATANTQRRAESEAWPRPPTRTLFGRPYTQPSSVASSLAVPATGGGATGAAESTETPDTAVPLALATPDRYVTDWREIPGREAGVLWWRKSWLTEIRHEVRALPSSRDPTKLSNVAIDSELRERPNASYPWQPAEVATPVAREAHAEIRARVLAAIRTAVVTTNLKRGSPR